MTTQTPTAVPDANLCHDSGRHLTLLSTHTADECPTRPVVTLRTLSDQRRRLWDTIQSLETAQIAYDCDAVRAALETKRTEWRSLNRQIRRAARILAARHASSGAKVVDVPIDDAP